MLVIARPFPVVAAAARFKPPVGTGEGRNAAQKRQSTPETASEEEERRRRELCLGPYPKTFPIENRPLLGSEFSMDSCLVHRSDLIRRLEVGN